MSYPQDAAAAKQALREHLLNNRRALDAEQLESARESVCRHVLDRVDGAAHPGSTWRRVFGYEPLPAEPGSIRLLEGLADRGASILVPLTRPDNDLDWLRWPESTTLGVEAVASATVLLVPALAVDRQGMRLGRGGGSYDRVLARVPDAVLVVALLHRGELFDSVPTESWDRPVDAAVTPDGWLDIKSPLARHRPPSER
ncbi:MAG: 5-formyltetrahydrofolate cyclo-ligase [Jatrophihabitans sp.]